jgi:hypothetical protein
VTGWRRVIDPPERGETVWVKDENIPDWKDKASLVTSGHDIWISETTGHIVYPTHWKDIDGHR